ncbi:hypothetical protein C1646_682556 [Rhizophagus diaphanus]|nr:hypothetical protein C1646_682556 [Rhizophagus diaphanus] [Rhizophagus sp. MUCL 43196]
MSSSIVNPSSVLGGVVFSKIRCYLNPEQIGKKIFGKTKVQLVFSYNKKQKFTTKSEIVLNNDKTKKRANWNEQIYFELLSDVSPEFSVSVYNTAISGPDGRLGEATENFKNVQVFKIEENRVSLPLLKQGEEKIGEVFFHVQLLSKDPPRSMMEMVSDRTNNDHKKKVGLLLINNVKFKNLAGRRGTLEVKLRDESHSTEGYWNTTMKEWRYPIALTVFTNPNLDLIIQCRYTEHERASTRICLGPNGIHEHIWKNLMNGPFKAGEFSLHDNEYDSARIEFTISCHKIVTSKALFYPDEVKQESPFVDTNQIINEEIRNAPVNNDFNNNFNNNITTTLARAHTISYTPGSINTIGTMGRSSVIPEQSINPEHNYTIAVAQKVHYIPRSPHISPQLPPIPNGIGDSTNIPQQIQNIANTRQIVKPRPADSSQLRNIINNNNNANSIPVPPKHPRRQATVEEETDSEHIRVNNSPPSSERMINVHYHENDARDISNPNFNNFNESNIPPQYKNPNPDMNSSSKHHRISPPPPPYPKQSNSVSSPRIICQRFVIVNPLRLSNMRGRREEVPLYPQNKLYKGHHIFTKQDVIIKEFSSQLSYESETAYLKDLSSRHIVKWVDMESDPSTGEFYSITEYYGRALQLEARKFNVGKIKQVFKNICTAVNWIHSNDVVHLDLNPTNIICKEGKDNHKIKICDFETSRQFGDIIQVFPPVPSDDTQSTQSYDHHQQYSSSTHYSHQAYPQSQFTQFTQFTLGYTCPELLLCCDDDEKDSNNVIEVPAHLNQDIFSVGCILYFLYNNNKALYNTLEDLEESFSLEKGFEYKIRKDIEDDRAADLILKCVNKKPNERPTIEEVLDDRYFRSNIERNHSINSRNSHDSIKSDNLSRNSRDSVKSESLNGSNGSNGSSGSDNDER